MFVAISALLALVSHSAAGERQASAQRPATMGAVVEEVVPGSALDRAGLAPGDVVVAWDRSPTPASPEAARGAVISPFDWWWLVLEQAPRGAVRLQVIRGEEPRTLQVEPGKWEAEVGPVLAGPTRAQYLEGLERARAGDLEAAARLGREAQADVGPLMTRAALWLSLARAVERSRHPGEPQPFYDTASELLGGGRVELRERAVLLLLAAQASLARLRLESADHYLKEALAAGAELAPDSLIMAFALAQQGSLANERGRASDAEEPLRTALAMTRRWAPGSLLEADVLDQWADVARTRGELKAAAGHLREALAIRRRLAPGGADEADSLSRLGALACDTGELEAAETLLLPALALARECCPDSLLLSGVLASLGKLAFLRGHLDQASELQDEAFEIRQRLAPGSHLVAQSLNSLGNLERLRGYADRAEDDYRRAIDILERVAPESRWHAGILNNLGGTALANGDLAGARTFYKRSLELNRRRAPESLEMATNLTNLGIVEKRAGELAAASAWLERALEIQQRQAPDSLSVAASLSMVGLIALEQGDLDRASRDLYRALEIRQRLAPGSVLEILSLGQLSTLHRQRGELQEMARVLSRAVDTIEADTLGSSSSAQIAARARGGRYYRGYIWALLALGKPELAFHVQERSRARRFLEMLAERDLLFTAEIPADLEQARRRLAIEHDRVLEQMAALDPAAPAEELEALQLRRRDLRREAEKNSEQIRRAAPRPAALRYPKPLDLEGARKALEPGTVLLSYVVGEDETFLFALSRDKELQVKSLDVGWTALEPEIGLLRNLIAAAQSGGELAERRRRSLEQVASGLYEKLIAPVADLVDVSERILLVPDGPLHALPFGALIRQGAEGEGLARRQWQYLVEWKPLHVAPSVTVYAELRERRRRPSSKGSAKSPYLAAFGDPELPQGRGDGTAADGLSPEVAALVERGLEIQSLPSSRWEVERIAQLFPNAARTYLGSEATEERAKAVGPGTRILHFATHAYLDERFPLDSGLILTAPEKPGRENGLLQAWEIFEQMRLDADLVVLSACDSGLGSVWGGEGMIGLTRAFQYAGASSVVASLWKVADRTTADLMVRFYRHLRAGEATDEALRSAQIELIRGEDVSEAAGEPGAEPRDASAPYFWAAFQLYGLRQ